MILLDGRSLAAKIRAEVKDEIVRLGVKPGLAVILVGNDPASHLYVSLKERACAEVGIHFEKYLFFATEPEEKIIAKIQELNGRADIHGILVQLPLPQGIDEGRVVQAIDAKKDVDGFHQKNLEAILRGAPSIIPGVTLGIAYLIDTAAAGHLELKEKNAVLVVNSTTFAAPLEYLLEARGMNVHIVLKPATMSEEVQAQLRRATVVVVAVGIPNFVGANALKDGVIAVDVGTNRLEDGRLVGDIDFESVKEKPGFITPVPGGVGPMTVAMLLKNTLTFARRISPQAM